MFRNINAYVRNRSDGWMILVRISTIWFGDPINRTKCVCVWSPFTNVLVCQKEWINELLPLGDGSPLLIETGRTGY